MSDLPLLHHVNYFDCYIKVTKRHDPRTEQEIKCLTAKLSHIALPIDPPAPGPFSLLSTPLMAGPIEIQRHRCLQKMIDARQYQVDRWSEIVSHAAVLGMRLDMSGDGVAAPYVRQTMYIYRDELVYAKEDIETRMRLFRIVTRQPLNNLGGVVSVTSVMDGMQCLFVANTRYDIGMLETRKTNHIIQQEFVLYRGFDSCLET